MCGRYPYFGKVNDFPFSENEGSWGWVKSLINFHSNSSRNKLRARKNQVPRLSERNNFCAKTLDRNLANLSRRMSRALV